MSQTPQSSPAPQSHDPSKSLAMVEAFAPGKVLDGKYKIARVIGQGGLGVVVAATHLQLDQQVAIKHLKPIALSRPVAVERFLREARLAAQVRSEHVTRIYDVGTTELGCPYIVMEYLEGTDLGDLLGAERCVSVDRAVDYLLQACEALAEAHALGITHRDLKPENLFLAKRPGGATVIKILDFGISKLSEKREGDGTRQSKLTSERETFGTPNYMSPEQLQSAADVDARSDIWALGVILYELVSGQLPFDDDDLPQLCLSIVNKPAPPLPAELEVPAGLQKVIARCLEKERANRFRNLGELASELAAFAPKTSLARVEHVRQVVVESGSAVPALAPRLSSTTPTQAISAQSAPGVSLTLPGVRRPGVGLVALAAAGLLVGFVVIFALVRRPVQDPGPRAAGAAAAPTATSEGAIQTSLAEPAGSAEAIAVAPAAATAATASPATASPPTSASAVVRSAAAPSGRKAAAAPNRSGAPIDTTAKKHAEFGDRQ